MAPIRRKLLSIVVAAVAVTAVAVGYLVITGLPANVLVRAGTVFENYTPPLNFTVSGGNAQLVGSWYANQGGFVVVCTRGQSCVFQAKCMTTNPWNGTSDVSLAPGEYWLQVLPRGTLVVTQPIRLIYPGNSTWVPWASFSPCGTLT